MDSAGASEHCRKRLLSLLSALFHSVFRIVLGSYSVVSRTPFTHLSRIYLLTSVMTMMPGIIKIVLSMPSFTGPFGSLSSTISARKDRTAGQKKQLYDGASVSLSTGGTDRRTYV